MKSCKPFLPAVQYALVDLGDIPFVIHEHMNAYGVHFDFRFLCGKHLIDFCLPHGFSRDPKKKRRAIEQPVHDPRCLTMEEYCVPLADGKKEAVMRWDEGAIEFLGDPADTQLMRFEKGVRTGRFRILLHGKKLQGTWLFEKDARGWWVQKEEDGHQSRHRHPADHHSVLTARHFTAVVANPGFHNGAIFTPLSQRPRRPA